MPRRSAVALVAALCTLVVAACGGVVDPSKNQVETFRGTVEPLVTGAAGLGPIHMFTVSKTGEFTAVVTSFTPAAKVFFGLVYGQSISGQCNIINVNSLSQVNVAGLGGPIVPGSYCIAVYDAGNFTVSQAYSLNVSHP